MLCSEQQLQLIRAVKDIALLPSGELILNHLKRYCRADEGTFSPDTHLTAYNEGMRAVYLELQRLINIDEQKLELFNNDTIEDIAI
jgi:hypothetical protein